MEKLIMTAEDMKLLTKIIEDLNRIKLYGIKAEAHNKRLRGENPVKWWVEMPSPEEFLEKRRKPNRFEELHDLIKKHIGTIEGVKILDEIKYEDAKACVHGRVFYNEIHPYQANAFILLLYDILCPYMVDCKYYVETYDIPEIAIGFESEETARKFIDIYGNPCTLFKEGDFVWEEIATF